MTVTSSQVQILNDHNNYRARHGAQPLRLDDGLNRSAQAYAQQLAYQDGGIPHSSGNYGENLFMCHGLAATSATHNWYNEVSMFNFNGGGYSPATGHFTALVWRSTTSLGVGIAQSGSGRTFVVAHYYPPGNHAGQFGQNVLPAGNYAVAQPRAAAVPSTRPMAVANQASQIAGQRYIQSYYGGYLRAWQGQNGDQGWLVDMAPHCKLCEHWYIVERNGKVLLKAYCSPDKYLRARPEGTVDLADKALGWEEWTPVRNGNGTWSFRSHHGTWLRAQPHGRVSLQTHCDNDERFTIGSW